jgi:hypothetical protein
VLLHFNCLPLMNAKYRMFALDQRGHGDSDRPASGYKFSDFAADVVAFMDAKNLKKAVVVGGEKENVRGKRLTNIWKSAVFSMTEFGSKLCLIWKPLNGRPGAN